MRSTDPLDSFNLDRFLQAQDPVFDYVLEELAAGCKRRHWMWFIFPQIAGLGGSEMSRRFAIQSAAEAMAYLDHAVLGTRLRTCTQLVLNIKHRSIGDIFGHPDNLKFHSSIPCLRSSALGTVCSIRPWTVITTAFRTSGPCRYWTQKSPSCPPIRVEKSSSTNGRMASAIGCSCRVT